MTRFFIVLFLVIVCFSFAEGQSEFNEMKYNVNDPNLPHWVKLMYSDSPNLKIIEKAYNEYYSKQPFEKNTYTQYYKRWIRDKWEWADNEGNLTIPTLKERQNSLGKYLSRNERHNIAQKSLTSQWEELGPWEYDHEATMALSVQSPGASHVYAVEQASSNQDIAYAGTANAGVWKSIDKGVSWDLVTGDYPIRGVYSLEIDHSNPDIVYAHGDGFIWKSIDGGATWSKTGNEQYFSWTRDIIMHPTNSQILLAATTEGLYRTSDAGSNWTLIQGGHFQEIEFHPTNGDIVYVVKHISNRTELYKSDDLGITFTLKSEGWPGISTSTASGLFSSVDFDSPSYASFGNVDLGSASIPEFTIDMRIKSSGWSGDPSIISNKNWNSGGNKGFIIAANGSGWKFNIGDGSSRIDLNGGSINDNEWHHIAVTYSATGDTKVYQDGTLLTSTAANISNATMSGLNLAMAQDGTENYGLDFPGSIAEVRIWSDTLSAATIFDLNCNAVDNTHPFYGDLIHYWKMDNNSGSIIADSKGSNHGAINGNINWAVDNEMVCIETDFSQGEENKRVEIAVTPHAPNSLFVLATGSADGESGLYGFYKSTDQGESFDFVCCGTGPGGLASVSNPNIVGYSNELTSNGGQYYYDLSLAVSPTDSNKIFAAGISVVRSEDGGQNWETNGHWVTWVGANTKERYTHADVHDVKFFQHGNDVSLWTASDGGLFYSANEGDNFEPRMHGIHGTEFWGFGGSYKEDAMIGGTYHNGTLVHYKDTYPKGKYGKGGWFAGAAADLAKGYVHEADGKRMFNESGLFEIINRDVYWKYLNFDNSKNANQIRPGQYGNYAWHPYYYEEFYTPRDSVLYKTENNGKSWQLIQDFGDGDIYEIKIPVTDPNIIYVVQNHISGVVKLWKTIDGGNAWTEITPPDAVVNSNNWRDKLFDIDLDDPDNIWMLLKGNADGYKVFESTDGGLNWVNISGSNLDGESMLDIVHHQGTDGGLYVGSTNSIYYKNNSLPDWELYNEGLPLLTRANYLYPYYTGGKIRMGTYRGAFERDFYEDSPPMVRASVDKKSSNCARDTFYFKDLSYVQHDGISWEWIFEGGTPATSSEENPKVVFGEGSHDVTLTVTNDYGSQTRVIQDMVTVSNDCIIDEIPGNAMDFTASSQSYAYSDHENKHNFVESDFSLSLWVKSRTTSGDAVLIAKKDWDSGINPGWVLATQSGKLWFNMADGTSRIDIVPNIQINDGEWHFVTVTVDRDDSAIVYLDGKAIGVQSSATIGDISNDLELVVGADSEYDYKITALVDEVCIYDKRLSLAELRDTRHLTKLSSEANLITYYQANESQGMVLDKIGVSHLVLGEDANRVISHCPIGGGESQTIAITAGGVIDYNDVNVEIVFPSAGIYPDGDVVVSRIDLFPDTNPSNQSQSDSYWVINNYGDNSVINSLSSIQFSGVSISSPSVVANDFKLYKRSDNAEGQIWIDIDNADIFDYSSGEITFSSGLALTEFGQFTITNERAKGWIGVVSEDWDNPLNWGMGMVPGITDDVIIPPNTPYQPKVNVNAIIGSLILLEDASIMIETGKLFEVKN